MDWSIYRERLHDLGDGRPRYERIASAIEAAIGAGDLHADERLPTVRQLSKDLEVSGVTVSAAYNLLSERGWARGEVGRGTFIARSPDPALKDGTLGGSTRHEVTIRQNSGVRERPLRPIPWRRRALVASAAHLRTAYPTAIDCTTGRPDPQLFPLAVLKRAWNAAMDATGSADLQYPGSAPVDCLVRQLLPRLKADGVPAHAADLVIASSAQQIMVLTLEVATFLSDEGKKTVAVEEPGYYTAFDTFERMGYRLLGVQMDAEGAVPASLAAALAAGATTVLLTPRAHNPTGASWSIQRARELADVLAAHPGVIAMEDDFSGVADHRAGSLLADSRIEDRVVYIRSFSKAIAPDLRIAVAVARPPLRRLLADAKSYADGWTSLLIQRTLANVLADSDLDAILVAARDTYSVRREKIARAVASRMNFDGVILNGADGVNIWVPLPYGSDAAEVIERAAQLGVLVAAGEPFFIRPGHGHAIRVNTGAVAIQQTEAIGIAVGEAALAARDATPTAMTV